MFENDFNTIAITPPKRTRVFYVGVGAGNSTTSARAKRIIEDFKKDINADSTYYENFYIATTNGTHIHIY